MAFGVARPTTATLPQRLALVTASAEAGVATEVMPSRPESLSPYLLIKVVAWLNDRTLSSCASTVSRHFSDPARLIGRRERAGDDRKTLVLAGLLGQRIDHRLGDAVELRLIDEPFARVRRRIGVVADDVDAFRQGLFQNRRDGDRIVGGEQNAVDAAGDIIVDELDLLVDLRLRRPVRRRLDVAEFFGRVLDALRGGVEITD